MLCAARDSAAVGGVNDGEADPFLAWPVSRALGAPAPTGSDHMARTLRIASLFLAAIWAVLGPPTPARAAEAPGVCHFEIRNTAEPGWWAGRSTEGTVTSAGGTIVCTGMLDGRRVATEAGTFGWRLRYGSEGSGPLSGGSCIHGRATGTWEAAVPLADGSTVLLAGPVATEWFGVAFTYRGHLGRHPVEGVGEARSDPDHLNEDCLSNAFQHYIDTGQFRVE